MNKIIVLFSCVVFTTVQVFSQSVPSPAVLDQLFPPLSVELSGFVGGKLDASYQNRVLAQDVDRLIAPFRNRTETSCWQTEFWGKWFTSAVLAYRYKPTPQLKKVLDNAVDGLIATQTPDGYIGNYADVMCNCKKDTKNQRIEHDEHEKISKKSICYLVSI